jgi:hypothetical protein
VSELTRLKQITAEIFVHKGLDAALNIDRESFNTSHPHYQYITRWVHRSLRQVVNTLKGLAADLQTEANAQKQLANEKMLAAFVAQEVVRVSGDSSARPVDVDLTSNNSAKLADERKKGRLALNADKVFQLRGRKTTGKRKKAEDSLFQRQIKAVAQVLEAYGLLDKLTYDKQEELLRAIVAIFSLDKEK